MTIQSKVIGIREMRGNFSAYIARVGAGESFDITKDGRKVAVLSAPIAVDENWWPSADPKSPMPSAHSPARDSGDSMSNRPISSRSWHLRGCTVIRSIG